VARLFLAVWPPPAVVERLASLPRPDELGVRWVPAERLHLTLRFLGEADTAEVASNLTELPLPATEVTLGPVVSRLGRNVVVIAAAGLDELAAVVRDATASIGRPPDPRSFAGHLTLARLRNRAACGVEGTSFHATFPATEMALVQSTTADHGVRYTTLSRYVVGRVPGTP
jgi:2'-5' RNA ligase